MCFVLISFAFPAQELGLIVRIAQDKFKLIQTAFALVKQDLDDVRMVRLLCPKSILEVYTARPHRPLKMMWSARP